VITPTAEEQVRLELSYLPDDFIAEDRDRIEELAYLAVRHVENDSESSITVDQLHEVAQTLIAAACDARTLMIFYISLLNADEIEPLKLRYDSDLLQAARNVAIIRLLNQKSRPKQMPIRKVLLRQLVLKVTHDVRVIIVKIAGRLVTLRHAENWSEESRRMIAQEALEVVVPWCDALGLEGWRQELQELSFKYLYPDKYAHVLSLMQDTRHNLYEVKDQVIRELTDLLHRHHTEALISGRVKTHYAVYRKMQTYEVSYDEIWDRVGIRILTNSVFDCYYIQMAIEEELYPERRRYQDYIATPRQPYNYQSLHLTVTGPRGIAVEIQIRTFDMHIKGEYGVAAHWKMYGGGEGAQSTEDAKFAFLRTQASKLLGDPMDYLGNTLDTLLVNNSILPTDTSGYILDPETGERVKDSRGQDIHYRDVQTNSKGYILDPYTEEQILSESGEPIWYQGEVLPDRVIVYTPHGDLKRLEQNATPLDFAYSIHEDVGHTCVSARVNGIMQRLDYTLQMGDQIEIITRKDARPSLDWLYNGYARTRRAQGKIRRYFREKTDVVVPEAEELGKAIINKRMSAHKIRDLPLERLAEMLNCKSRHELLEMVGTGEIDVAKLDGVLSAYLLEEFSQSEHKRPTLSISHKDFDVLYNQAQCCFPLPGDETISYISQGRGFVLHRVECRNVGTLDPSRLSDFQWPDALLCNGKESPPPIFFSRLILVVVDPTKSILFIKEITSMEDLPIDTLMKIDNAQPTGFTQIVLTVRAACRSQVERLMRKLNASDDILMIRRPAG
jgi:(p)ppGpp synthase/HD superfamily hydrolase